MSPSLLGRLHPRGHRARSSGTASINGDPASYSTDFATEHAPGIGRAGPPDVADKIHRQEVRSVRGAWLRPRKRWSAASGDRPPAAQDRRRFDGEMVPALTHTYRERHDGAAAMSPLPRSNAVPQQHSRRGHEESRNAPWLRPGAALLFNFIRDMALNSTLLTAHLQKETMLVELIDTWHYSLVQGTETEELEKIRRELVPRCYRVGAKLDGPGWAPILLGREFQGSSSTRQIHLLNYALSYCRCLWCLLQETKAEQSCPSISSLEEALDAMPESLDLHFEDRPSVPTFSSAEDSARCTPSAAIGSNGLTASETRCRSADGISTDQTTGKLALQSKLEPRSSFQRPGIPIDGEQVPQQPNRTRPPKLSGAPPLRDPAERVSNWPLPRIHDLAVLGDCAENSLFEIGVVSKLSSRGGARFALTGMMQGFRCHSAYAGPLSMTELYVSLVRFATAYYRQNKGKLERRVYIQGGSARVPISTSYLVASNKPYLASEVGSKGILASPQIVHIFYGTLVLEGSIDSFISTDIPYFVGFGDERGAQAVYAGGVLGAPRPLGVMELLRHTGLFDAGPQTVQLR